MTNREFAKENNLFKMACIYVKTKPTKRQASKWRQHRGIAYTHWKAQQ